MTWCGGRSTRVKWVWAACLAAAVIAAACERRATTEPGTGLAGLELTPPVVSIPPAGSADFVAVALTETGDTADVTVTWTATGGSVIEGGLDRGRHLARYRAGMFCGDYTVVAIARPGNQADTAAVTVTCPTAVASIEVTPSSASVAVDSTVQLTATARDSSGSILTGRAVTWSSSASGVAAVSTTGLVTGIAPGTAVITALREGVRDSATVTVTAPPQSVVFVGAGDIADCGSSGDEATAALLDSIAGTVFTTGDNVYPDGTSSEFSQCYEPSWGRHRARTRPVPGNHDYHTGGTHACAPLSSTMPTARMGEPVAPLIFRGSPTN